MTALPPLPNGFVLDGSADAGGPALSPLPPGFRLDTPAPSGNVPGQAQQQPGAGDYFGAAIRSNPVLGALANGRDAIASMIPQGAAPQGPTAQARYDAALDAVRKSQYPGMSDAQWQAYSSKALAPYNSNDLLAQGSTLGFGDELGAAVGALGSQARQTVTGQGPGFGDAYSTLDTLEQARRDLGREQQGGLGTAAEMLGGLAAGGAADPAAAATAVPATGFGQTIKTMLPSVGEGAAYGFGSTDGSLQDRALGAGVGAGAALAAGGLGAGIGGVLNARDAAAARAASASSTLAAAPSAAAIKATARAGYRASEATGAVMSQSVPTIISQDFRTLARNEGLVLPNGQLSNAYPKVASVIRAADQFAKGPLDVKQFQILHRMAANVAKSADTAEAGFGSMLTEHLDNLVTSLPKSAFVAGDGKQAVQKWMRAQNDWARFKRTETVETAVQKAARADGGFAVGLKNEFRKILNSERKARNFPKAQLDAMDGFVRDNVSAQSALFQLAHGSPFLAEVMGHVLGGFPGAMAAGAARMGVKRMAQGRLDQAAQLAASHIRANMALPNGVPPIPTVPPRLTGQQIMMLRQAAGSIPRSLPMLPAPASPMPRQL